MTNDIDRAVFESYSKEQVYVAYLTEYNARVNLNRELNEANRLIAEIKFKCTR